MIKNIKSKQRAFIIEQYKRSTSEPFDRFMINAFFHLSDLNSDLSHKIDQVETLFDAIIKYDNYCVNAILTIELQSSKILPENNFRKVLLEAIDSYMKNNDDKVKRNVLEHLNCLIIDAMRQYQKRHGAAIDFSHNTLNTVMIELFENYSLQHFNSFNCIKPEERIIDDLFHTIENSPKNEVIISNSNQPYISKPFNMWSVLMASSIIKWFTLHHLFYITKGDLKKIKEHIDDFSKSYISPYRFQHQIIKSMNQSLEFLSHMTGGKNQLIYDENDYDAEVEKFKKEKQSIQSKHDVRRENVKWKADHDLNKEINSNEKKEISDIKPSAEEIKRKKISSTRNQNRLQDTYDYVLRNLQQEYYGVYEPYVTVSSRYIDSLNTIYKKYIELTNNIFVVVQNGDGTNMRQVKAMKNLSHNFSFLYQRSCYIVEDGETEIFSEYADALSKGSKLQAIMTSLKSKQEPILKASASETKDFESLKSLQQYAYYYPFVFLHLNGILDQTKAKKNIEQLTPMFTQFKSINDKSFDKNFETLKNALEGFNSEKVIEENIEYFFNQ